MMLKPKVEDQVNNAANPFSFVSTRYKQNKNGTSPVFTFYSFN